MPKVATSVAILPVTESPSLGTDEWHVDPAELWHGLSLIVFLKANGPAHQRSLAYCQARMRLPEKFFSTVTCLVGRALDAKVSSKWLWKGQRRIEFVTRLNKGYRKADFRRGKRLDHHDHIVRWLKPLRTETTHSLLNSFSAISSNDRISEARYDFSCLYGQSVRVSRCSH